MRFEAPWFRSLARGREIWRPTVDLELDRIPQPLYFIVDTGADISVAPKALADRMGLDWESGKKITMHGISPKPECSVEGRIHEVTVRFVGPGVEHTVQMCFAEGDVPRLLGRLGLMPPFRVTFDADRRVTTFATE